MKIKNICKLVKIFCRLYCIQSGIRTLVIPESVLVPVGAGRQLGGTQRPADRLLHLVAAAELRAAEICQWYVVPLALGYHRF